MKKKLTKIIAALLFVIVFISLLGINIEYKADSNNNYEEYEEERLYLFDNGDTCDDITGGWYTTWKNGNNATVQILADSIHLYSANNTYTNWSFHAAITRNQIDFTEYSKVVFIFDCIDAPSEGGHYEFKFGVDSSNQSTEQAPFYGANFKINDRKVGFNRYTIQDIKPGMQNIIVELDIADYEKSMYVDVCMAQGTAPPTSIKVKEIYLVKDPMRKTGSYLTINPNGGIYDGKEESTTYYQELEQGETVTQDIDIPTREGYTFLGWTLNSYILNSSATEGGIYVENDNGSELLYASGEAQNAFIPNTYKITYVHSAATMDILTANWARNDYSLTIDPNGGTWEGLTDSYVTYGELNTEYIIENPVWRNHDFLGWKLTGTGTMKDGTYKFGAGNATLTALWKANTAILTVDPNGGTWETHTDKQDYELDIGSTMNIPNPTREGYTFKEWTIEGTGSSLKNGTFTMGEVDATITAQWEVNHYSVLYIDVFMDGARANEQTIKDNIAYGTSVRGSNLTNTYPGYDYDHDTQDTVKVPDSSGYGATVYRYFSRTLVEINSSEKGVLTGSVNWIDQNNKFLSRPETVTVTLKQNNSTQIEHIVDGKTTTGAMSTSAGLTTNSENAYTFSGLPKYDITGKEYTYTVEQSKVVSNNTDDTYKTEQSGYVFTNILQNNNNPENPPIPSIPENPGPTTNPDPSNPNPTPDVEEIGYTIKGTVEWKDNADNLGLRPSVDTITLQKKNAQGSFDTYATINISNVSNINLYNYMFTNLPKYIYDENGNVKEAQEYRVIQTFTAKVVVNNVAEDAYTSIYTENIDPVTNLPNGYDFINTLNNLTGSILPLPEYENTLIIKHNVNDSIPVVLKQFKSTITNGNITYSSEYSGITYNVDIDSLGKTINKMYAGKYEVDIETKDYILNSMYIEAQNHVSFIKENGKWYLTIHSVPDNTKATLIIQLSKEEHTGFSYVYNKSNVWKITTPQTNMLIRPTMLISPGIISILPERLTITYHDSDTVDENIYYNEAGLNKAIILDYVGTEENFIGWTTEEGLEEVIYLPNEEITLTENLNLYPVFQSIEEEPEDLEDTEKSEELPNINDGDSLTDKETDSTEDTEDNPKNSEEQLPSISSGDAIDNN